MEEMHESVYKFIEAVGTSEVSWEDAVKNIVKKAAESIEDIRIVEIKDLDAKVENQEVVLYRVRVKLSFKLKGGD
ncbi:MAG TPA: dodecin family protein [Candidatus Lokiarchaeia archaeon]|nr:dodecin family protein [Candidatus Lokiarchaeia archaeon]